MVVKSFHIRVRHHRRLLNRSLSVSSSPRRINSRRFSSPRRPIRSLSVPINRKRSSRPIRRATASPTTKSSQIPRNSSSTKPHHILRRLGNRSNNRNFNRNHNNNSGGGSGGRPTRIILASDENKTYVQFWEPVSKHWSEIHHIRPTLFFVGD